MLTKHLTIQNKLGLHTRAAIKLMQCASCFISDIAITANGKTVNVKSIMGVMLLAASKGTEVVIAAAGSDEQQALAALTDLINDKFGEEA